MGEIILTNGCQVVHVPTYLVGLWKACKKASDNEIEWVTVKVSEGSTKWQSILSDFDSVVLAAGSGLFHSNLIDNLPITLVRGQSLEIDLTEESSARPFEAVLCGKYISPIKPGKILIGATHEYKAESLSKDEVTDALRERSYDLSPVAWDRGVIKKVTSGWRVQSERGALGRLPIVGRISDKSNTWIFTGLGSRGLIHHGIYGKLLAESIINEDDVLLQTNLPHVYWWRK
mmetsp:Transcript_6126/g.8129  ORF Transcript_6126/g.8129 Transcript_6126/m.8129 type:complete len:231 (+) Transcript_6126:922-1614(+)